jgi:amidophosphoribosyltransferase
MELGLVRSHYSGRTFIQPTQEKREAGVKSKLNPIQAVIKNKKVVLIDDSIVRGTTAKQIIKMLKDAGAKEVHLRLSCPPIKSYCPYGIDIPTESELISSSKTTEELKAYIDANSVGFLSLEGLYNAIGKKRNNFCDGCLTKKYKV